MFWPVLKLYILRSQYCEQGNTTYYNTIMMSYKKPHIPQSPTVPVEEEIEEDLKAIDETEAPLLTGE